jgi:hypothetical protein
VISGFVDFVLINLSDSVYDDLNGVVVRNNPKVLSLKPKSWSFSEGFALDWSYLVKNKPCLEWPICGVEKV